MTTRRSAIVTGSTSGIGLGIAKAFAAAGIDAARNGFRDLRAIGEIRAALPMDGRRTTQ